MLKVGLTGGIGCGKSEVARLFHELGAPVIDADEIVRSLVEPGQPALNAIAEAFGPSALEDGQLNRAWLRQTVFRSPCDKQHLEGILHPRVYATIQERMTDMRAPYCILVIPLLLETAPRDFVDRILVVDCPVELQVQRVKMRDGLDDETIQRIIASQASRAQRIAAANDLVDNQNDLRALRTRVAELHRIYDEAGRGRTLLTNRAHRSK